MPPTGLVSVDREGSGSPLPTPVHPSSSHPPLMSPGGSTVLRAILLPSSSETPSSSPLRAIVASHSFAWTWRPVKPAGDGTWMSHAPKRSTAPWAAPPRPLRSPTDTACSSTSDPWAWRVSPSMDANYGVIHCPLPKRSTEPVHPLFSPADCSSNSSTKTVTRT